MYDELVKRLRERCVFLFPHHGESRSYDADLMHEAADAIEKLQTAEKKYLANISALETENQHLKRERYWIPVTERLPLYGQDVLAVRTYEDGEKCQEVLMAHIAVWNEETGEKWWNVTNITHWMPLPEPPKEE